MVLLIGSLTQYFDSAFNGFSLPQRRWVYFLVLSTSALIALYIQHISELSIKQYCFAAIPVFIFWLMSISICGTFCQLDANLTHTYYYLSLVSLEKKWLYHPLVLLGIVVIFFVQQVVMTIESSKRTIGPYSTTMSTITDQVIIIRSLQK